MKLGSLFDGSGGFPLAGIQLGIEPVWASEIEPFPIRVTTKRIPQMKHYGNIMDMNGAKIEPVDIITFGSPCVDLSVAGKREGLQAERSGLFFEAIRVIKEMKEATNGVYPKYIVWENVCGAFSSNKGEDFRAVLESICQIADETVSIPKPDKWTSAGSIVGDGYSVAWRVLNAEHFGVPQRRRRIFLVASFGKSSAADIMFREVLPESQGLRGDPEASGTQGQTVAGDFKDGTGAADYTLRVRCGKPGGGKGALIQENKAGTLATNNDQTLFQKICLNDQGESYMEISENVTGTLRAQMGGHQPIILDKPICYCVNSMKSPNPHSGIYEADTSRTLDCKGGNPACNQGGMVICYGVNGDKAGTYDFSVLENQSPTMIAKGPNAVRSNYIVRRLTPVECARLQGFPDWWCSGLESDPTEEDIDWWYEVFETRRKAMGKSTKPKSRKQIEKWLKNPHSDYAEYKMWGNGVALPCVYYVLKGIVCQDR